MTFLNPLVLFGLIAAAIPVLLHLLNLRKLRTVEFSTLAFLKELQQTKIRRLKLRQLLLLLIRTLIVILIILAFARPVLRGTMFGAIGGQARSTVVMLLDDSFSTTSSDEQGNLFTQIKTAARSVTDLLRDGDEVFLLKLSELPQATIEPSTHDMSLVRRTIDEAQVSPVRRTLSEGLSTAARLLEQSRNANREVYIITDGQKTLTEPPQGGFTPNSFPEGTRFFFITPEGAIKSNVAIDSVEVLSKIIEREKPVRVAVSVRNFNNAMLRDYVVSVFLDGVRAAQGNVTVEPWSATTVEFSVTPKRSGFIKGYVELESDAVELDNRRYFALSIPDRIRVTMVGPRREDLQFPLLALEAGSIANDDGNGTTRSMLDIQQTTPDRFPLVNLNQIDVLLLSNVKTFSQSDIDRIKRFVERGGGLIFFPGPDIQRESYNTTFLPAMNIPPIEGITGSTGQASGLYFRSVDLAHPLFATIFEQKSLQLQRPQSGQAVQSPSIYMTMRQQAGRRGHSIITLNDGTAFLAEHSFGNGKILMYSVAPLLTWSDFPLKGLFAPLVHRSVVYASARGGNVFTAQAGDAPVVTILPQTGTTVSTASQTATQYQVISPDGVEEIVQPDSRSGVQGGVSFTLNQLRQSGWYELRSGTTVPVAMVSVNVDPRESDFRRASDAELSKFWTSVGIPETSLRALEPNEQLGRSILESRFGIELWKYCIGLALLLALLEMLIARESKQQAVGGVTAA